MDYYQHEEAANVPPPVTKLGFQEKAASSQPSLIILDGVTEKGKDVKRLKDCLVDHDQSTSRAEFERLCLGYKELCEAVVEFELSALTLRSNSTALTLCRKLVTKDLPTVFDALSTWEFRGLEAASANSEISNAIFQSCADSLKTVDDLFNELGKIDGSGQVVEYLKRSRSMELMGISPTAFEHSHVLSGIGEDAVDKEAIIRLIAHCDDAIRRLRRKLQSQAVKQGLKVLIEKQDHFRNTFMDLATVAIFFSSITASTLQFSFTSSNSNSSWTIVNVCWYASLVLSIASATNSFLGAVVHQSPEYLRPSRGLDHKILQTWFKCCPPALLAISGMLFLVGICTFTLASTQGSTIQIVTTTLTSANFLTLLFMFLLSFTRVIHHIVLPTMICFRFLARWVMVPTSHLVVLAIAFVVHAILILLVFTIRPFVIISFLVYFGRLPQGMEYSLWDSNVFKDIDIKLHRMMKIHWDVLRGK